MSMDLAPPALREASLVIQGDPEAEPGPVADAGPTPDGPASDEIRLDPVVTPSDLLPPVARLDEGPPAGAVAVAVADPGRVEPGRPADVPEPGPSVEPIERRLPRASTIRVLLPSSDSELVVRGDVGRGNPDEWYGPVRVIHTIPLDVGKDYLVGAFWTDPMGTPSSRKHALKIEPGRTYEVDLTSNRPSSKEMP